MSDLSFYKEELLKRNKKAQEWHMAGIPKYQRRERVLLKKTKAQRFRSQTGKSKFYILPGMLPAKKAWGLGRSDFCGRMEAADRHGAL